LSFLTIRSFRSSLHKLCILLDRTVPKHSLRPSILFSARFRNIRQNGRGSFNLPLPSVFIADLPRASSVSISVTFRQRSVSPVTGVSISSRTRCRIEPPR
jgi:hypothetical protein